MIYILKVVHYCYVFEDFRNMCLKIYQVDTACFLRTLKKTKAKLGFSTDNDILFMEGKGIRDGTYHTIYQYVKANNKYMKNHNENKKSLYFKYWDVNNLYG